MHPDAAGSIVASVVRRGRKIATARVLVAVPWASLSKAKKNKPKKRGFKKKIVFWIRESNVMV